MSGITPGRRMLVELQKFRDMMARVCAPLMVVTANPTLSWA